MNSENFFIFVDRGLLKHHLKHPPEKIHKETAIPVPDTSVTQYEPDR